MKFILGLIMPLILNFMLGLMAGYFALKGQTPEAFEDLIAREFEHMALLLGEETRAIEDLSVNLVKTLLPNFSVQSAWSLSLMLMTVRLIACARLSWPLLLGAALFGFYYWKLVKENQVCLGINLQPKKAKIKLCFWSLTLLLSLLSFQPYFASAFLTIPLLALWCFIFTALTHYVFIGWER